MKCLTNEQEEYNRKLKKHTERNENKTEKQKCSFKEVDRGERG